MLFKNLSLARVSSSNKFDAESRVGWSNFSLKNKRLVLISLGNCASSGWIEYMSCSKGLRVSVRAGQSKRKCDSFSILFIAHSLQKRSFLLVLSQRPVSISSLRVPNLNFVKRDLFFLVFSAVRWGATFNVWGTSLNRCNLFWAEISEWAFYRNWSSKDFKISEIIFGISFGFRSCICSWSFQKWQNPDDPIICLIELIQSSWIFGCFRRAQ